LICLCFFVNEWWMMILSLRWMRMMELTHEFENLGIWWIMCWFNKPCSLVTQ
jgi:hypothetical protein